MVGLRPSAAQNEAAIGGIRAKRSLTTLSTVPPSSVPPSSRGSPSMILELHSAKRDRDTPWSPDAAGRRHHHLGNAHEASVAVVFFRLSGRT